MCRVEEEVEERGAEDAGEREKGRDRSAIREHEEREGSDPHARDHGVDVEAFNWFFSAAGLAGAGRVRV